MKTRNLVFIGICVIASLYSTACTETRSSKTPSTNEGVLIQQISFPIAIEEARDIEPVGATSADKVYVKQLRKLVNWPLVSTPKWLRTYDRNMFGFTPNMSRRAEAQPFTIYVTRREASQWCIAIVRHSGECAWGAPLGVLGVAANNGNGVPMIYGIATDTVAKITVCIDSSRYIVKPIDDTWAIVGSRGVKIDRMTKVVVTYRNGQRKTAERNG